ncbi:MAG: shikimate kinase [Gammaproteobacteria bacterium]
MPSIFLVGPMGSGKSAVGRRLARLLGRPFLDTDAEIEARTGVDIPFIFDKEGEAGFRARERAVIAELTARPGIVLATGGGAVVSAENLSKNRPLLDTPDPGARLEELMALRERLYREVASLVVNTDGRRVASVARELRDRLVETPGEADAPCTD